MKKSYVYDEWIQFWEKKRTNELDGFATVTVLQRDLKALSVLALGIVECLEPFFPRTLQWLTVNHSIESSKTQELRTVNKLKSNLPDMYVLRKNVVSNRYSYVVDLSGKLDSSRFCTMDVPRYTALILAGENCGDLGELWEQFSAADRELCEGNLKRILENLPGVMIGRIVCDEDTHAVMQFFGRVEDVDLVVKELGELLVERVLDVDVAELINS